MVLVSYGVGIIWCWYHIVLVSYSVGIIWCWYHYSVGIIWCWYHMVLVSYSVGIICCWYHMVLLSLWCWYHMVLVSYGVGIIWCWYHYGVGIIIMELVSLYYGVAGAHRASRSMGSWVLVSYGVKVQCKHGYLYIINYIHFDCICWTKSMSA